MQYALLVYQAPAEYEGLSQEEQPAVSAEYYALRDDPQVFGGARFSRSRALPRCAGGGPDGDHRWPVRRY